MLGTPTPRRECSRQASYIMEQSLHRNAFSSWMMVEVKQWKQQSLDYAMFDKIVCFYFERFLISLCFKMFLSSGNRPHNFPTPPPHPQTHSRPCWASQDPPITKESAGSRVRLAQWNAGIRPRPVWTPVPQLGVEALRAFRRSHRSIPS